jgi:hypothetical protein
VSHMFRAEQGWTYRRRRPVLAGFVMDGQTYQFSLLPNEPYRWLFGTNIETETNSKRTLGTQIVLTISRPCPTKRNYIKSEPASPSAKQTWQELPPFFAIEEV